MTHQRSDRRISALGAAILAGITVISGLIVYTIMQRQAEFILGATLELSLQSRASQMESAIDNSLKDFVTVATRPFLIEQLNRINIAPDDVLARQGLQRVANSFIPIGLSALSIVAADGREVVKAGAFTGPVELQTRIKAPYKTRLLWKDGFVLNTEIGVFDQHRPVGLIRAEERLPSISAALFDTGLLGKSGELAICAPVTGGAMCFPMALIRAGIKHLSLVKDGHRLPMSYALAGKSGVINAVDYRAQAVVAAYKPIGATGLGMVLKLDRAELYKPITGQLIFVIPIVILLVAAGVLILNCLVAPLLRKLVQSESETRLINAELRHSEMRFRAIFASVNDGIIAIQAAGTIESVNPAVEKIFGYAKEEIVGQNIGMLLPEQDRSDHDDAIRRYLASRQPQDVGTSGREVAARCKDGTTLPIEIRISEMKLDSGEYFIATLRDISARKRAEAHIIHLATHDPLTDLPNRHLLNDRIEQAITQARRRDTQLAILFLDMDGFKFINDTLGHAIGDHLLIEVAQRIKRMLRNEDTVARQGGDEFIVAMPNIDVSSDIVDVAQKLLDVLSVPYVIQDQHLDSSASIGISVFPQDGDAADELIKHADAAMYFAKNSGRNRYIFASALQISAQGNTQRGSV